MTKVVNLPARGADEVAPSVVALRAELEAVGRLDTFLGQHALALAERIASGRETGAAVSSLSKELRTTRVEALQGAKQAQSRVEQRKDELAARRRA